MGEKVGQSVGREALGHELKLVSIFIDLLSAVYGDGDKMGVCI